MDKFIALLAKYPALARGLRSLMALGVTSIIAYFAHNSLLVWLTPVVQALAKAVRDKFGYDWIPV